MKEQRRMEEVHWGDKGVHWAVGPTKKKINKCSFTKLTVVWKSKLFES